VKKLIPVVVFTLILRSITQGMVPLLPLLVEDMHISKLVNGVFMTTIYSMLLVGSYFAGNIFSHKIFSRQFLILTTGLTAILIFASGFQHGFLSLLIITSLLWLSAGVNITTINIITNQLAGKINAGRYFGIIAFINLTGAIIGGFTVGPMVEKFGCFNSFSWFTIAFVITVSPLLFVFSKDTSSNDTSHKDVVGPKFVFTRNFKLILIGTLLVYILVFLFKMALTLFMKNALYTITEISIAIAIGSVISSPFAYLFGHYTSSLNKKLLLIICYSCGVLAFVGSLMSSNYIVAITSIVFISIYSFSNKSISPILILDYYDSQHQNKALSYYDMATCGGGALGFAVGGTSLEYVGFIPTFIIGLAIAIIALFVITKLDSKNFLKYH
jgi:MFS family permease